VGLLKEKVFAVYARLRCRSLSLLLMLGLLDLDAGAAKENINI